MNFSINKALKLIIGVMTLGFVTLAVVGGPVDDFLNQVEEEVDKRTTSNPRVQIDSRSELAGIAKLSMDRAAECDSVRAHQYPDLSETRIGSNPNCRLGLPGEGVTRDYTRPTSPLGPGDDVEGVDSRIRFNITQDMTLRTDREYGTPVNAPGTWFASPPTDSTQGKLTLTGVSDKKYSEIITQNCNAPAEAITGNKYRSSREDGATYGYILTFSTDSSSRHVSSGSHEPITDTPPYQNTGGVYCTALGDVLDGSGSESAAMHLHRTSGRTKVKLCDGDKGYVQVNKKKPYKTAETEDTGENLGDTPLFGYVQITESSGSCRVNDPIRPYEEDADDPRYSGNLFMVELNVDNWPGPSSQDKYRPLDILKNQQVQDFGHRTTPEMNEGAGPGPTNDKEIPDNKCAIGLTERGPNIGAQSETRYTLVKQGEVIDSENGLPEKSSWSFPNSWTGTTLLSPGVPRLEEDPSSKAWQLYDRLKDEGFDGSSVKTSSLSNPGKASGDLIFERESGHYLELYGPVLCGYETDNADTSNARARWHLCLPDDATSGNNPTDGVQVDVASTVKECTDGSWDTVN